MLRMNNPENINHFHEIEVMIAEKRAVLAEAVKIVTGGSDGDPTIVFRPAGEVRADDEGLALNEEQEAAFREVAGRLGIGGEEDVLSGTDHQLLEGGKPWKIEAELAIATGARTVIFAASPYRKIGQDEVVYMLNKPGVDTVVATNEYDMARQIAETQPGFEAVEQEEVLPFGYDINDENKMVNTPTGQFVKIGVLNGAEVVLLRVDRENYIDNEGNAKYRKQPDGAALLGFVSDVLSAAGDEDSSVGFLSSSTYASRSIDTIRAGINHGRKFIPGMYGRQTLANVQGKEVTAPTDINQIPGELHTIVTKLDQLQAALREK